MKYQRQGVTLLPTGVGRADLKLLGPSEARSPLFAVDATSADGEPWALHFRLGSREFQYLKEIHTYTETEGGHKGSRRAPRWKRDSILVWPPSGGEQRYLELGMVEVSARERIGHAFSVALPAYQRKYESDELDPKTPVYIAGCGRSGTTLLQRLMRCYDSTHVAQGERPFTAFLDLTHRQEQALVVKRDANAWQFLPWLPPAVKVLYCVRHPFDVLTSFHPGARRKGYYIKLSRWRSEFLALKHLLTHRPEQVQIVRYEDLILAADEQQEQLSAFTGLRPTQRFSAVGESLTARSIRKWTKNEQFAEYLSKIKKREQTLLNEFLERFDYEQ